MFVSICFFASQIAFEQSERSSRKSYTKNNMEDKKASETRASPESGLATKFLDSENEGSTILRNQHSRYGHYATDG
jgi:hypothetical protein